MGGFLPFRYSHHQDAPPLLIVDMGRNIPLAEFLDRSFRPDVGANSHPFVVLASVDLVPLDDRKAPAAGRSDTEPCCSVAVDMDQYYYVAEQVRYRAVVALEPCCFVAVDMEQYYYVAEQVRYRDVAEPSRCYAVLKSARHFRQAAVGVDVAVPQLYCWHVEVQLGFHYLLS